MTRGLVRYQECGHHHFITFSCFRRKPFLGSDTARTRFEHTLERTRIRYGLVVMGYVVMPEHVHLLITEPMPGELGAPQPGLSKHGAQRGARRMALAGFARCGKACTLARAIQALKISVSRLSRERPFWQARYYDFNVFTARKRIEKLRYIHRNPVKRGLVSAPEDWPWSSYRHYLTGEAGRVTLETW
jgi:putative transposase